MECSPYLDAHKSLVWGILYQAFYDSVRKTSHAQSAYRFINGTTGSDAWLFDFYCTILGLDAQWMREQMNKAIERKINQINLGKNNE